MEMMNVTGRHKYYKIITKNNGKDSNGNRHIST
jgi:hypothetical protein